MTLVVDQKVGTASSGDDYLSFSRAKGSIDALDGLRTLAIGLVLFRHAIRAMEPQIGGAFELELPWGSWSLATPMMNGWMGVDLFFVLSGFLIGGHLIRHRDSFSHASLARYFGARALRILPTYYCVLFLVAVGFFPLYTPLAEETFPSLIWHMLFLQDYLPSDFIVAFWSLGVEEKFYIIAPLLVISTGRLSNVYHRLLILTLLVLAPSALRAATLGLTDFDFDSYQAYFETFRSPFHLTFDGLLVGVICAEIFAHQALRERLTRIANPMLMVGMSIIAIHLIPFDLMARIGLYDVLVQPLVLSIGFGLILLAVALANPKKGWMASRFSLVGARLSYGMYLVHMALIPCAMIPTLLSGADGIARFMVFFASFVTLSAMASWLLHFGVEKPFLQLKSRLF